MFCADSATRQEALLARLPSINAFVAAQIASYAHKQHQCLAEVLAECRSDAMKLSRTICPGMPESRAATIAEALCTQVPWEAQRREPVSTAAQVPARLPAPEQEAPRQHVTAAQAGFMQPAAQSDDDLQSLDGETEGFEEAVGDTQLRAHGYQRVAAPSSLDRRQRHDSPGPLLAGARQPQPMRQAPAAHFGRRESE